MNAAIIIQSPPSPHPAALFSPFVNPTPLRLAKINPCNPITRKHRRNQFRYRNSTSRCCASSSPDQAVTNSVASDVFGGKKELTGIQPIVDAMSPQVRLVGSTIVIAGAVAAGYGLGLRLGGSRNAALGGAVALGAAGAGASYTLNSCVPEVAAVHLHNYVAGFDDPVTLKKEDIDGIAHKYGVSKQNEAFNAELCDLYCRYVSAVLPAASEDLTGYEVETIIKFKTALGIDDPDAAAMHIEIGRRYFRQRLEAGGHDADREQLRAFQKLIYVSSCVFGEASTFLLPWKRVFKVSDSQVEVAIRDNAQRLYTSKLKSIGRDVGVRELLSLRETQLLCRLSDELAEDMFREHVRKLVEGNISTALRKPSHVVEELDEILAFNHLLISLSNHPDASSFARGVGPISLLGGLYDTRRDDLKLLFKAYFSDALSSGCMEQNKRAALNQLRILFNIGKQEAESIMLDVTMRLYRKRLAQALSGGDLEAAPSKATFLQNLCDELHLDPQKAIEIHEGIYREKLQQGVADGELDENDVEALERLQVMLCIPRETVEAFHSDICGRLFEKAVKNAIASGPDGYNDDVAKSVRKAAHGLRLTREVAMTIAGKAVRKILMAFVRRALAALEGADCAKELKNMIIFNILVATRLVADVKGESSDTTLEESIKDDIGQIDEDEEWNSLPTLQKARTSKELPPKTIRKRGTSVPGIGRPEQREKKLEVDLSGRRSQTEITLKNDLPESERKDLYKKYLRFCIIGDAKKSGSMFLSKEDDTTEYVRLNQLGGILGLTNKEIVEVHRSVAELTFRKRAEQILANGQLTKGRVEKLSEIQKEVGLPAQYAQEIIKSVTSSKLSASLGRAVGEGKIGIKEVRKLKEVGMDIGTMIPTRLRESLFIQTVEGIFSSGTGEFDEEEVYQKLPQELKINAERAKGVVHELAGKRLSNSLIQAVALLRQKNNRGVVSHLENLLACDKAAPSGPLSWGVPEERADLFAMYAQTDPAPAPEKLSRLRHLLCISDSTAETKVEEEEEIVF